MLVTFDGSCHVQLALPLAPGSKDMPPAGCWGRGVSDVDTWPGIETFSLYKLPAAREGAQERGGQEVKVPGLRLTFLMESSDAVVPARNPCAFAKLPDDDALPTVYATRNPCLCAVSTNSSSDGLLTSSQCSSPTISRTPNGREITPNSKVPALFLFNPFASMNIHPSSAAIRAADTRGRMRQET